MMAAVRRDPEQKRVYNEFLERANLKCKERDSIEEELKQCEAKLAADPKLNLSNPVVPGLMKHQKFTELTKEIMDAFVSTVFVHEGIIINPETKSEETKLNVKVSFKFEKLE